MDVSLKAIHRMPGAMGAVDTITEFSDGSCLVDREQTISYWPSLSAYLDQDSDGFDPGTGSDDIFAIEYGIAPGAYDGNETPEQLSAANRWGERKPATAIF